MNRRAWQATVHGVAKELDMTEQVITGGRFIWGMQAVFTSLVAQKVKNLPVMWVTRL